MKCSQKTQSGKQCTRECKFGNLCTQHFKLGKNFGINPVIASPKIASSKIASTKVDEKATANLKNILQIGSESSSKRQVDEKASHALKDVLQIGKKVEVAPKIMNYEQFILSQHISQCNALSTIITHGSFLNKLYTDSCTKNVNQRSYL